MENETTTDVLTGVLTISETELTILRAAANLADEICDRAYHVGNMSGDVRTGGRLGRTAEAFLAIQRTIERALIVGEVYGKVPLLGAEDTEDAA